MWEDIFQIYRCIGDNYTDLMASDMTIDNAILFVKVWMQENYNDQQTSLEIRRQPIDYGKANPEYEEKSQQPMTNAEKFKEVFGNIIRCDKHLDKDERAFVINKPNKTWICKTAQWLDMPYIGLETEEET